MDIIGYQAIIHVTQVLPNEIEVPILDPKELGKYKNARSWLCAPFKESITYGVHFTINKLFSWDFYLFTETKEKAVLLGESFLLYLRDRFRGLDGFTSIIPLHSQFLDLQRTLFEIKIPIVPEGLNFPFLHKLINYYNTPLRKFVLDMFILWKRFDLAYDSNPYRFLVKCYLSLNPTQKTNNINPLNSFNSVLKYLVSDLSVPPHLIVDCELLGNHMWKNILTCNIFPDKEKIFPNGMRPNQNVPFEYLRDNPSFCRENVDFYIPKNFPLQRPPVLKNRNVVNHHIHDNEQNSIFFGYKMKDGILTDDLAVIPIDALNGHLNIFGKSRTGKSTLGKIIIHEVAHKRPDVGILIINLVKPNMDKDFPMAKIYRFPSKDFRVPYIIYGNRVKKAISGTTKAIAACLGLKYVGPVLISETLQTCYQEFKEFPLLIRKFFNCIENNIKAKPYDPKFQQRILTALERRIAELFQNPELQETLSLLDTGPNKIPEWFSKWKQGNVIFLDLTQCDEREQHLLIMFILQIIETFISFENLSERLRYLIYLDEAHRVLGTPKDQDYESIEFIMKNNINHLFANSIEECGEKGLGFIISEQRPALLMDCAFDSARINILFRLGYPNNEIHTGNLEEREMLLRLQSRYALVLNENERYLCKTLDDPYA